MQQHQNFFNLSLLIESFILAGMGVYFIFIRAPLLPEDFSYIDTTATEITNSLPGLPIWLKKVFIVLGGYIFTTGLLICYIAISSGSERSIGLFITVFFSGLSSIGLMTAINFIIDSDFKVMVLLFTLPWIISLVAYFIPNKVLSANKIQ
jgi:hypothetical protein